MPYVWIFLGGGIGAAARHGVNRAALLLAGADYPAGTLFVNIAGSLMMGVLAGWFTYRGESAPEPLRLFLTTGVVGGFTTFSAFALDAAVMWQRHDSGQALAYVGLSVIGAIVALFAGLAAMRALMA
jgi:fluoride exporter